VTGKIQRSNSCHSFKVFLLDDKGQWIFLGLIPRGALAALLRQEIIVVDICKFSQTGEQVPLVFNLELKH
jgi:hypothetical protein